MAGREDTLDRGVSGGAAWSGCPDPIGRRPSSGTGLRRIRRGLPDTGGMAPEVSSSLASSARHRVRTRLRLIRMRPRRARFVRELVTSAPRPTAPTVAERGGAGRRVLVIAHVYYPELWDELAAGIERIPGEVDLVVTLVEGRAEHLAEPIRARFPGADVRVLANQGRDVWPLLQVLDRVPGHDAVLKVHTKRSPHMRNGDAWRRDLLDGLVGSTAADRGDPRADGRRSTDRDGRSGTQRPRAGVPRANRPRVEALARQGGRVFDPDALWFPAGSMFWSPPRGAPAPGRPGPRPPPTSARRRARSTGRWPTPSSGTSASSRPPRGWP